MSSKRTRQAAGSLDFAVIAYLGPGVPPDWEDEVDQSEHWHRVYDTSGPLLTHYFLGHLKVLFRVQADTSAIVEETTGPDGSVYYQCAYELVMWFGGTEVKAQFAWFENVRFNVALGF